MSEEDARLPDRVRALGRLEPNAAARLLLPIAEGLAARHAAAQSHGSISPSAIRIDGAGCAQLLEPAESAPDPAFTAPDAARGAGVLGAADVWAFAAVLLHTTTGHTPEPGASSPRATGWLAPLIELALRSDPRQRPTMSEVADYLRAPFVQPTAPRRASGRALALIGAAAIVGLGLAGTALVFAGGEDRDRRTATPPHVEPSPAEEAGETSRSGSSEPRDAGSAADEPVTADRLEEFARSYVDTASTDPDRGITLLTRDYRAASPRYREVWASITDPVIESITADPETLSVSYTYRYLLDGVPRTEQVTLRLVRRGERLLIAGATGRLR